MMRPISVGIMLTVICCVVCGCGITKAPILSVDEVAYAAKRVVYATVDEERVCMEVFWPEGEGPFPMIVYYHGGGWSKTGQEGFSEPLCKWLANQGYVVCNVSYRLAPRYHFPAQVNDAIGAIIFVKENATRFNGDPTKVAVMGDSAGGNLAAMVALCWDDPFFTPSYAGNGVTTAETQANVFLYPVLDVVKMYDMTGLYVILENPKDIARKYIGGTLESMREQYRLASPIYHVRKDMSPTLLVCGGDDPLLPQSRAFKARIDELGVPNGLYVALGETHGFTALDFTKGTTDAFAAIAAFLDLELKHLRKRPTSPSPSATGAAEE